MFHPQAEFGSRDLTWRLANALKSRARKQGVPRQAVKQALDDTRKTNGIAFVPGHHKVDKPAENAHEVDDEADSILRGNVDDVRGEVLFQLAGRYTRKYSIHFSAIASTPGSSLTFTMHQTIKSSQLSNLIIRTPSSQTSQLPNGYPRPFQQRRSRRTNNMLTSKPSLMLPGTRTTSRTLIKRADTQIPGSIRILT